MTRIYIYILGVKASKHRSELRQFSHIRLTLSMCCTVSVHCTVFVQNIFHTLYSIILQFTLKDKTYRICSVLLLTLMVPTLQHLTYFY